MKCKFCNAEEAEPFIVSEDVITGEKEIINLCPACGEYMQKLWKKISNNYKKATGKDYNESVRRRLTDNESS